MQVFKDIYQTISYCWTKKRRGEKLTLLEQSNLNHMCILILSFIQLLLWVAILIHSCYEQ